MPASKLGFKERVSGEVAIKMAYNPRSSCAADRIKFFEEVPRLFHEFDGLR